MATANYARGLAPVGDHTWAWLQPDGSWGWSNAGLITSGDQALLVDTLFDVRLTREMLAEMTRAAPAAAHIGALVNTHANGDHCWGNQLVPGARIIASRRGAEEMAEVDPNKMATLMKVAHLVRRTGGVGQALARALEAVGLSKGAGLLTAAPFVAEIFGAFDFQEVALTPPTETFDRQLTVPVGDRQVDIIEVGPAHTKGDVIVHVPDQRIVFSGDVLFIGGHPICWEGPLSHWVEACDRILELAPEVIVPGHGPLTTVAGVRRVREYLLWIEAEARPRWEAGMSPLDAALDIDRRPFAELLDAERMVINVHTAYRGFSGDQSRLDVIAAFALMAQARAGMHR